MTDYMEAIVLVWWLGTRLASVVSDVPKPMADINGKPFLEYLMMYLKSFWFTKIILATGHKQDIIENYFWNSYDGMEVVYCKDNQDFWTGWAIKRSLTYTKSNNVFVLNWDTYFPVDLKKLVEFHISKWDSNLTLALKYIKNITRSGSVIVDENNKILCFDEKKEKPEWYINGWIYVINKDFYLWIETPESFSFEKDVMEKYFWTYNFYGMYGDEYFIDIWIPEDYARAKIDFKKLF